MYNEWKFQLSFATLQLSCMSSYFIYCITWIRWWFITYTVSAYWSRDAIFVAVPFCVCVSFFAKSLTLHFMYSVIDVRPTLSAHLENWKSQQVNAVNLDENIKDKLMSWNTLSYPLSVSFSSKILYKDRPLTSFLSMCSVLLFRHSRRLQGKRITEVWL